jgi:WD40 repeat protein
MHFLILGPVLSSLCYVGAAIADEPGRDLHLAPLPRGAKARLGVWLDSPNAATHSPPALSPDGKLLASIVNTRVQVWDVKRGHVIQSIVAHANPFEFFGIAFLDDDTLLTTGNDGKGYRNAVKAWDPRTGKLLRSFDVRSDWNNSPFALSSDGKLLALMARGEPGKLHVWDTAERRELFADKDASALPTFSSSTRHVITSRHNRLEFGKYDTIVTLRDARTGKNARTVELKLFHSFITDVSPDGKYLVGHTHIHHEIQDKWRSRLQLFDAESGQLVRTFLEQRSGDMRAAVFSPDGKFVTGVDHTERALGVWEVESGKKKWTFPNSRAWGNFPRFAPDGKTLLNATSAGGVFVHNLQTGATQHFNATHSSYVHSLAWSADGKRLASASHTSEIFVWDVATSKVLHRLDMEPQYNGDGNRNWAYAVKMAFAPDDQHLLTQEADQSVRLFAPHRGVEVGAFRSAGHVWGFCATGKHLLWSGKRLDLVPRFHNRPQEVTGDDLDTWLGAARWAAHAWAIPELRQLRPRSYVSTDMKGEAPARQPLQFFGEASGAMATPFGLSPDGSVMAEWIMRLAGNPSSGMGTYWVRDNLILSDVATGREIMRTKRGQDFGAVGYLMFAPDSRSFVGFAATVKDKRVLILYETRTGKERMLIAGSAGQAGTCAFSRDGRFLAFLNAKNDIEVFDVTRGKNVATFAQTDGGGVLAFSPDSTLLATGGRSGAILLWDLSDVVRQKTEEPAWTAADKDRLWNDLADSDAITAFSAMNKLRCSPNAAVALVRERLQWNVATKELDALIERLGSADFASRKKATDAVEQLGERARPALAAALAKSKSLEHKRRVEGLLEKLERPFTTPVGLRLLRSIEVLDGLRTPEAAALLREIAADVPATDPLGRELARSLERAHR